ncbi:putative Plant invertase/pectin methylesterase inhibitor superfamily protein [Hibiscus syriacus]|uniref:Plant invertase/pectin methylesterase inhibitor superfamily protein n=1 Tax=Hibiscus syriacus TaxID=106335 RepID=A0A6A3CXD0_HIBSY|nr:putative Plant invertase/pectin methylesterase inhibitor superfamily protein [Hibiscus syriacus]
MAPIEENVQLDLEKGPTSDEEHQIKNPFPGLKNKAKLLLSMFGGSFLDNSDDGASLPIDPSNSGSVVIASAVTTSMNKEEQESKDGKENNKNKNNKGVGKEKRNKKAPKPPRPPKGPTLDAADYKLIRELTELARLKRANIERTRALKKMKAAKGTSNNTTIFAMLFTIIFCVIIVYQGMPYRDTPTNPKGYEIAVEAMGGGPIPIKLFGNPSSSISYEPVYEPSIVVEHNAGLDGGKFYSATPLI